MEMAGHKGYYSLIQYCPDYSRMEVANIGVVLFCPELRFLKAQMARGSDRIRRIFHGREIDLPEIEGAKMAIAERFETAQSDITTLDDLKVFIGSRGNDILLTPPRPVKVAEPVADLNRLFLELVGGRSRSSRERGYVEIPELDRLLRDRRLESRIRFGLSVPLPIVGRRLEIPYAYQNGVLNLIRPKRFPAHEAAALNSAYSLAVDGDLLFRHPEGGVDRKLIVVSAYDAPRSDLERKIHDLLGEFGVRDISVDRVPDLVAEIERYAHP